MIARHLLLRLIGCAAITGAPMLVCAAIAPGNGLSLAAVLIGVFIILHLPTETRR